MTTQSKETKDQNTYLKEKLVWRLENESTDLLSMSTAILAILALMAIYNYERE